MPLNLLDTRIVLVRPRNPLNIAAAARAMKNFGLEDLVLVAAYEPVWLDARAAPGAKDLLRSVRTVGELGEALEDRTLVLGTSSLSRRRPAQTVFSLNQLGTLLKRRRTSERLAILFGSEKTGLSNRDLEQCHAVLRIPTEERAPSMNLGQAVAVCCYELARCLKPGRGKPQEASVRMAASFATGGATVGEVNRLVEAVERLLGEKADKSSRAGGRSSLLRELFLRSALRSRDVTLLLGVLRDIAWRMNQQLES